MAARPPLRALSTRVLTALFFQFTSFALQFQTCVIDDLLLQAALPGKGIINGVETTFLRTNLGVQVQLSALGQLIFESADDARCRQQWDNNYDKIIQVFDSIWPDCPPPFRAAGYNSRQKANKSERRVDDVSAAAFEYVTTDFKNVFSSLIWRVSEIRYDRNLKAVQSLCHLLGTICNLGVQIKVQCLGRPLKLVKCFNFFVAARMQGFAFSNQQITEIETFLCVCNLDKLRCVR